MHRSSRAALLLGALLLTGCAPSDLPPVASPSNAPSTAPPAPSPPAPSPPDATASPAAQPSLAVDVYRTRSDPASGRIQISVENRGDAPITVVRAELASPALSEPLVRDGDTVIPPGARRDLPVTLTTPLCPADDASLSATITLLQPDDSRVSVPTEANDRLGQWRDWLEAECFTAAVLERVELSLERAPERDRLTGGVTARIGLTLLVVGTGSAGTPLEIGTVSGTPLLTPIDAHEGATRTAAPAPGATVRIPVDVAPARCDPHAIAEDKQGTLFPLAVTLGEEVGRVIVAASDEVRAELYAAITAACGGH